MTNFTAIKELKAVNAVNTPDKLIYRLRECKQVLNDKYKKMFIINRSTINYELKCVYSTNGMYKLQWYLRNNPSMPESYNNQQTMTGIVKCELVNKF